MRRSLSLRRLLRDIAGHWTLGLRNAAQILGHQILGLRHVEIADDRQRGVLRDVVGAVEVAHVLDRRGLEVAHAADGRVLVRMRRERLVVDDLVEAAERLVVHPHPALFLHDLTLVRERLLVDPQRGHAVGFQPQRQRQVLRRHRFPEHRDVVFRVGVGLTADRRDHRRVPFGLHVARALEHQVLEEMREPRPSRLLVLRADVIPQRHVHDGRRMILGQDRREPVGQRHDLVFQLRWWNGGRRCEGGERDDGRDTENADDGTRRQELPNHTVDSIFN